MQWLFHLFYTTAQLCCFAKRCADNLKYRRMSSATAFYNDHKPKDIALFLNATEKEKPALHTGYLIF
jgi:hypothetical protein